MLMHRSTLLRLFPLSFLAATLSCGSDGGGSTGPTPNPVPTLTSLSRDTAMAGATPFVLTLRGSGFVPGISATIGGNARTTVRTSDTVATVQTVAADLATVTTREVRVTNPEPGGGTSDALILTIHPAPPVPVLDSITPDTATRGGVGRTLHAFGSSFGPNSKITWNGIDLTTSYLSATHLSTTVTAGMIAVVDTFEVRVRTPAPGGGTSAPRSFEVAPPPAITGTVPDSVEVGPGNIPFLIRGSRFTGADSVRIDHQTGTKFATPVSVTDTTVAIDLDRTGLVALGNLAIRVHTPQGWTASHFVDPYNPTPVISGFTPDTLDGSAIRDTFVVIGTGFMPGMVVRVGGIDAVSSTVLSYDSIRAVVTEGPLLLGGTPLVTVFDGLDGHLSAPVAIAILSPAPTLDSISPTERIAGVGGNHRLFGANFRQSGDVLVNGTPHPISFFTTEWVDIHFDSADVALPGTYSVAFQTPGPGGGTTDTLSIEVLAPNPVPVLDSVRPEALRSDSGAQFLTLWGRGFIPGTVIELGHPDFGNFPETDTIATIIHNDSLMVAEVPAAMLTTGRVHSVSVRAPAPTTGVSQRHLVPVWTTGVRSVATYSTHVVNTLVSDTLRDLIYEVSVNVQEANEPTLLIARDPTTGALVKSLPLPDHGGRLFYSGAGQYLYAICASGLNICRVDLNAWSLDWSIPSFEFNGGPTAPLFIAPQSSSSTSFVVGVSWASNEYANLVKIYDDTIPRAPIDTFFSGVHSGRFFGDTLVMMNGYHTFRRTVSPGGQSPLDSVPLSLNLGVPAQILSSSRAIADGHLMDLTTGNDLATHPAFHTAQIATGPDADRFYTALSLDGALHLYRFDLTTGTELLHVGVNGADPRAFTISPTRRAFLGHANRVAVVESTLSDP